MKDKKALREKVLERRNALSDKERALQSLALGKNLAALLDSRQFPDDALVGAYHALPGEIDLTPFLALLYGRGNRVAFPAAHEDGVMEFYELSAAELDGGSVPFIDNPDKVCSEDSAARFTKVDPHELTLLVIPGISFDKKRARLGYGAGYYDRFLGRTKQHTTLIGVCFDCQLEEELPVEAHDYLMDMIVTPTVAF